MDHNSIIDRETFKVYTHAEDYPKAFVCDKPIANAVAILNKKGYKTFASCSGHYKTEFYEYFNEDISHLEEMQKDDHIIIKNIDDHIIIKNIKDDGFDFWAEVTKTGIYILFDNEYDFGTLPDGFNLEISSNRSLIFHDIYYYDESNNKKTRQEFEEEIKKYCEILNKWANDLPERKE